VGWLTAASLVAVSVEVRGDEDTAVVDACVGVVAAFAVVGIAAIAGPGWCGSKAGRQTGWRMVIPKARLAVWEEELAC